jgi:hypothetical protein
MEQWWNDDRWSNGGMMIGSGNRRTSDRDFVQFHFVHHEFQMKALRIEPEANKNPAPNGLSYSTAGMHSFLLRSCIEYIHLNMGP